MLGLCLTALPLTGAALVAVTAYGGYYGLTEVTGRRGLAPPGRRWQVPQTLVIAASPRRRALVWGAILGPGLATRNPYAGFGLLPLAVAAMSDLPAGVALGAAIGLAHGTTRALALLRDVREARGGREARDVREAPRALSASVQLTGGTAGHLDLLLKTVYWRRLDGCILLVAAAVAVVASVRHFT